jgi:hypothetical protein
MMKISQKAREELLKTQPEKKNNATVFCTKYTKGSEKMKAILKKHWHIPAIRQKLHNSSRNSHWCSICLVAILETPW